MIGTHEDAYGENCTVTAKARLGRPVDTSIDHSVVQAVLSELSHNGYRSITMERIARKVGCARASLYRRWPSKRHLVAFAVVTELSANPSPDTGSLRKDLIAAVQTLITGFHGPLGPALAGLVGEMSDDAELARTIRKEVLAKRRCSMRAAVRRGIMRGELQSGVSIELLMDMLTAPFYFRTLFGHVRLSAEMVETVVDTVLRGAAR